MIELRRDVTATAIPYGQKTPLPRGSRVEITQELGGSYTVLTDLGLMRIEGKDADALGMAPGEAPGAERDAPTDLKGVATAVWDQLKSCFDPEIPVNIVELGLVYENRIEPLPAGGWKVDVKMTLTAPGCGMGTVIAGEAQSKILSIPGVRECQVELVLDPPWDSSKMSEAAKLQLGML